MSYVDQRMSSTRITAIVIVALLHALLGYVIVTGLAFNVIKKAAEDLKTFDIKEEPPPPEQKPPPPPKELQPPPQSPPVVSPPPIVSMPSPPPQVYAPPTAPPAPVTPVATPAPPAPPAPPRVEPAHAKANLGSYVSNDDYPPDAIRDQKEGTTGFRLEVGTNGRVTNCTVTSSSGSSLLDQTTCRLMKARARFTPAHDASGNPMPDAVSARIVWRIPAE